MRMDDFSCIIDVQMFVPSAWSTAHDEFTYTSLSALYESILESPCSMRQWRSASGSVLVNYQGVNFGGKNTAKIHPRTSKMSCVFSQCTPHASRPRLGAALLSISGQFIFKLRIFFSRTFVAKERWILDQGAGSLRHWSKIKIHRTFNCHPITDGT